MADGTAPQMPLGGKRLVDFLSSQLVSPNPCLTPRGGSLYQQPTPPKMTDQDMEAIRQLEQRQMEQRQAGVLALLASPLVLKSFPLPADYTDDLSERDQGDDSSSSCDSDDWCSVRERAGSCISESCASEMWCDAETVDDAILDLSDTEPGREQDSVAQVSEPAAPESSLQRPYVIPRLRMEEVFRVQASRAQAGEGPTNLMNNPLYDTGEEGGELAESGSFLERNYAPKLPIRKASTAPRVSLPASTPVEKTPTPASDDTTPTPASDETPPAAASDDNRTGTGEGEFEFQVNQEKAQATYENLFSPLTGSPLRDVSRPQHRGASSPARPAEGQGHPPRTVPAAHCDAPSVGEPPAMDLSPLRMHRSQLSQRSLLGSPLSHRSLPCTPHSHRSQTSHRSQLSVQSPREFTELMRASTAFKNAVAAEVEAHLEDLLICLGQEEQKNTILSKMLQELGCSPEELLREHGLDDQSLDNKISEVPHDASPRDASASTDLIVTPCNKASTSGVGTKLAEENWSPTSVLDAFPADSSSPEKGGQVAKIGKPQATMAIHGLGYLGWVLLGLSKLNKS